MVFWNSFKQSLNRESNIFRFFHCWYYIFCIFDSIGQPKLPSQQSFIYRFLDPSLSSRLRYSSVSETILYQTKKYIAMAVSTRTSDYCCIQIQKNLDAMGQNTPANFPYDGGLMAALKDPRNVGQFTVEDPKRDGKGRPQVGNNCIIEIEYEAPFCADAVDGCLDICAVDLPAQGDSLLYLQTTVDYQKSAGGTFTEYEFACLCEAPNDRLTKRIEQGAKNIKATITKHLAELMYAQAGSYSNGNASNAVTAEDLILLNPAGYTNPAGMIKMINEHRRQYSDGAPFVVGGLPIETWQRVRGVSGLNGNDPVAPGDPSFGASLYVDLQFDQAIKDLNTDTDDHAISWSPGAFQLLEWYENKGYMEKFKEDYTFTVMTIDGIDYDFYLRYQECTRTWSWVLCKAYDLFCLTEAMYAPCIIGNHKMHWNLTCADFDCAAYDVGPNVP